MRTGVLVGKSRVRSLIEERKEVQEDTIICNTGIEQGFEMAVNQLVICFGKRRNTEKRQNP